jgi:anti-anti-sigma factor
LFTNVYASCGSTPAGEVWRRDGFSALILTVGLMSSDTEIEAASVCSTVEWSGETTIESVTTLRDDLLTTIARGNDVAVDLRNVTRIDSAVLQLIVAARNSLAESGRVLHLAEVSDPVMTAVRLAGLAEWFADSEITPPVGQSAL